jgi:hypothetical protein
VENIFPFIISIKNKYNDPRKTSVFKYCYKLQKETNGILDVNEYKDYVYCQLKFLKMYQDRTNKPVQVVPSILNFDKSWKKWKYFKYLTSKSKYSDKRKPNIINNNNLKIALEKDKKFLSGKLILDNENLLKNKENLIEWHKLGKISYYFVCFTNKILNIARDLSKDYSIYKFDKEGEKLFLDIFPDIT